MSKYMKDKRVNEDITMDLPRLNCTFLTWLPRVMTTWDSSVPSEQKSPTICMASTLREVHIHLHSERCTVLDSTTEDTDKLEQIQQRETLRSLGGWSTDNKLKELFFQSEEKKTKQDLINYSGSSQVLTKGGEGQTATRKIMIRY